MSRSKRKTPICSWTTACSEKWNKRKANRKLRHKAKLYILAGKEIMPEIREVSEVYNFSKDGKQYLGKDAMEKHPDCMRK